MAKTYTIPEQQFSVGATTAGPFDLPAGFTNAQITLSSSQWSNGNTDHFSILAQDSPDGVTWQDSGGLPDVVWGTLAGRLHTMPSLQYVPNPGSVQARLIVTMTVSHPLGATVVVN